MKIVNVKYFSKPSSVTSAAGRLSGQRRLRKSSNRGNPKKRKAKTRKPSSIPSSLSPSHVFLNGNIITVDSICPQAEAVALDGGRILAVGSNQEIRSLIGQKTKVTDVKGATILPGFIDCHIHLIEYGLSLRNIDLRGVQSINEIKKRVSERARGSAQWILGRGWDQEKFAEKRYPTRHDLDEASPDKAVLLRRVCGHICVVNSLALKLAGIGAGTPDPPGGLIDRDEAGEPTGILRENAVSILDKAIPELTSDDYEEATIAACHRALAAGLTTVHCITGSELELKALLKLKAEGRLPLRFYVFIPIEQMKTAIALGLRSGFGDDKVRLGGVKVFADGSLGARTAAMEMPYADDVENRGVPIYTQQELDEIIVEAHRNDFQIAAHAIGDRAVSMVLHAFARAFGPASKNELRHRIEHASVLNADLIRRIRKFGLIASVQPHFCVSDFWVEQRVGAERASFTYPFNTLLRSEIRVVGGSDCPVEPLTPLSGIQAAVNRAGAEAIPVDEAISFYTGNAAYASFDEDAKGTITPGKLADLVILEQDPGKVPPSKITEIRVLTTIVGGRVLHPQSPKL